MTSISQLSNWQPLVPRLQPATPRGGEAASSAALPSSIVKLSPESLARASREAEAPLVLPAPVRFKDVGASLLGQLTSGAAVPVEKPGELPASVENKFTLSITTRTGVQVDVALANEGDGMAVQLSASAELNERERDALAKLATGFQAAIDGMLKDDPKVQLGKLASFDATALASVDFQASVQQDTVPPSTATLAFRADGAQRTVSIDGASRKAEVKVDTSKLATLGTKEQQEKAIGHYLKQFDQAAVRGRADSGLMTMFKDAFADLNRSSSTAAPATNSLAPQPAWQLAAEDHAALTGLADFSASVTQTPRFSNPLRQAEKDSFAYEVSQSTSTEGARRDDRSISQKQASRLTAQFHEARDSNDELKLSLKPESQTYRYTQIDDRASSDVALNYRDGRLASATLRQTASLSSHAMEYVKGKLVSDRSTPSEHTLERDLVDALSYYQSGDTQEQRDEQRRARLDMVNHNIFLIDSPAKLALIRNGA